MDAENFKYFMYIAGLLGAAYLLLLGWLFLLITKERSLGIWRDNEVYKRIKSGEDDMHRCRRSLEEKVSQINEIHMTEPQVKDFVDRTVRPLKESVDSLKENVEKGNALAAESLSKVQILLDRDSKRKNTEA